MSGTAITFPSVGRGAEALFAALAGADARIVERDALVFEASLAPQVTMSAHCLCGSVFAIRGARSIAVTDAELEGAAAAAGIGTEVAAQVIDAINASRAQADYEALADWEDAHAYCGGMS